MAATLMKYESAGSPGCIGQTASDCSMLCDGEKDEVLAFLAQRPVHTAFMGTLIRDNGLASPFNRGTFYGYRNNLGKLNGVALIGHATILEARTDAALAAFADLASQSRTAYLIRGERKIVEAFWNYYADPEITPRRVCRELMFEKTEHSPSFEPVPELRRACAADLEQVVAINALMAFEEGGVNPLERDAAGFRLRAARRIKQGRVWILVQQGKTIFKADVVGDTPEAVYLEGIHVHPEERLKGFGKRCLSQLSSTLLARTKSICLTVNQRKADTVAFYAKAGFDFQSEYETIYLQ